MINRRLKGLVVFLLFQSHFVCAGELVKVQAPDLVKDQKPGSIEKLPEDLLLIILEKLFFHIPGQNGPHSLADVPISDGPVSNAFEETSALMDHLFENVHSICNFLKTNKRYSALLRSPEFAERLVKACLKIGNFADTYLGCPDDLVINSEEDVRTANRMYLIFQCIGRYFRSKGMKIWLKEFLKHPMAFHYLSLRIQSYATIPEFLFEVGYPLSKIGLDEKTLLQELIDVIGYFELEDYPQKNRIEKERGFLKALCYLSRHDINVNWVNVNWVNSNCLDKNRKTALSQIIYWKRNLNNITTLESEIIRLRRRFLEFIGLVILSNFPGVQVDADILDVIFCDHWMARKGMLGPKYEGKEITIRYAIELRKPELRKYLKLDPMDTLLDQC